MAIVLKIGRKKEVLTEEKTKAVAIRIEYFKPSKNNAQIILFHRIGLSGGYDMVVNQMAPKVMRPSNTVVIRIKQLMPKNLPRRYDVLSTGIPSAL